MNNVEKETKKVWLTIAPSRQYANLIKRIVMLWL